jgi:DegV family protein with EDD domain
VTVPDGDEHRHSVRIVTDSACDLPHEVADELGITIVPLTIRFGDEEFVDRRDLTPREFWARAARSATLPETAAPAPGQFEEVYRDLAADGATGIVVIDLSAALSATSQSAELAARSVADLVPVELVDSRSVSLGLGVIVAEAARFARTGASLDAVVARARELTDRSRVWGALDTLENLKKGGRIGSAKALLASALAIKPIIEVRDGKVEPGGKQRTRSKALHFLVDKISESPVEHLAVMHADCDDVDQFVAVLRQHHDGEILVGDIGPVVGSHAGRGTIAVAYLVPATR